MPITPTHQGLLRPRLCPASLHHAATSKASTLEGVRLTPLAFEFDPPPEATGSFKLKRKLLKHSGVTSKASTPEGVRRTLSHPRSILHRTPSRASSFELKRKLSKHSAATSKASTLERVRRTPLTFKFDSTPEVTESFKLKRKLPKHSPATPKASTLGRVKQSERLRPPVVDAPETSIRMYRRRAQRVSFRD